METSGTDSGRRVRRGILYGLMGAGALVAAVFAARPIAAAVQGGGSSTAAGATAA